MANLYDLLRSFFLSSQPIVYVDENHQYSYLQFNSATGASNARLHYVPKSSERGAWSPSSLELGQWIQVDLGNITMVTKIATQGRKSALEWVTEYEVSYSFDGGYYKFYRQALNNSFDQVKC